MIDSLACNDDTQQVLCGIVTYNPEIERFKECVNSIINQVSYVLIVDNNSNNLEDIRKVAENTGGGNRAKSK